MENKFEVFAIVELFGHQKLSGKVTEHNVGSATFIRIDVPETKGQPAFTRLVNPSAIYAINPTTEEVATAKAEQLQTAPIDAWDIRRMQEKMVALVEENKRHPVPVNEDEENDEAQF